MRFGEAKEKETAEKAMRLAGKTQLRRPARPNGPSKLVYRLVGAID
jgi:hypothetical protein